MKIWARWLYIHLSVVFPSRMPAGPHFVTQPILLSETFLIFDINHQQKHKEVRPDWNDKNDNANYAPSYHMEGFTNGSVAIFKEIFDQVRKDLDCELFYSELKRHNVSHYIYYLATDNIHIVLENDNTVLIKGLKKVVNVKFSWNTHLIETSYDRLKSREITFQQYRENLLKQEFSDGLQISMNIKDITIPLIIHYYLPRAFRTLHKSSTLNHNVRFLPCQHRGVGIMQYVYALNPVCISFNYSLTLPQSSSPSGLWT